MSLPAYHHFLDIPAFQHLITGGGDSLIIPGTYGFLLNRIFAAARREADLIVDAGIASEEDIDKAMITGRNWPAGFYGDRGGIGKQW